MTCTCPPTGLSHECSLHGLKQEISKPSRKRRKPLPHASEEMAVLLERWKLIRGCFLLSQLRTNGYYSCMSCGLVCSHTYELDLDHIENRNKSNYVPANAQLLCNSRSANGTKNCHDMKHQNQPQWTEAS